MTPDMTDDERRDASASLVHDAAQALLAAAQLSNPGSFEGTNEDWGIGIQFQVSMSLLGDIHIAKFAANLYRPPTQEEVQRERLMAAGLAPRSTPATVSLYERPNLN